MVTKACHNYFSIQPDSFHSGCPDTDAWHVGHGLFPYGCGDNPVVWRKDLGCSGCKGGLSGEGLVGSTDAP